MQALEPGRELDADTSGVNPSAADLYNRYQWDIKQVTNDGASFALSTGSHATVVGIIDTGISTQHPDLKANLLGGRNFVDDGPGGTVDPADIEDRSGHGSHVAGAIAGNGRILGVAPDIGIRVYRVFGASGGTPLTRLDTAIVAAADDGVDVVSMSLLSYLSVSRYTWTDPATGTVYPGKQVADFLAERRAVQYATKKGAVVVAAAGNDAIDVGNPTAVTAWLNTAYASQGYAFYGASRDVPGTLAGVVTVSATRPDGALAAYSNYGVNAIDLSAPGGDWNRYPASDWYLDYCMSTSLNSGYAWMVGTSMATPKVAAVAALIMDRAKTSGQHMQPGHVVAALQQTATDLGKPGYDGQYGFGRVNAFAALSAK